MDTLTPPSTVIEERLTKLFPPDTLKQRARVHRVIVRHRKVDITSLIWALVLGFAIGSSRSVEEIRRTYIRFAGHELCASSFHERLPEPLVELLVELIDHALAETPAPHTMTEQLEGIRELVVADATVFQVHDLLADAYPATNEDRAGAKLHLIHNVTEATFEQLHLTDERSHDSESFENGPWLEGTLLLIDLAYFKFHRFVRIAENGGYFVSRLKHSANPVIVEELRAWRGNAKPLVGKQVWDVIADLYRQEIDVLVEVEFKRRIYDGNRSSDSATFRVVGHRHPKTGEYHLYITNLPHETFSPQQVSALYRCRWEIELLFRELKSRYRLDELPSSKPQIVKVLILASVLTLVVSRVLLGLFREIGEERGDDVIFPTERFARVFESFAPKIADSLSLYLEYEPPDHFELMYNDAQKKQSRPLLFERVSHTLQGHV